MDIYNFYFSDSHTISDKFYQHNKLSTPTFLIHIKSVINFTNRTSLVHTNFSKCIKKNKKTQASYNADPVTY